MAAALYTQEDSWYSFLLEAGRLKGHSAAGRIRSIEKSNDLIGNQTSYLLDCSIVPQPTTLPRAMLIVCRKLYKEQDIEMSSS
jgi:hypothetical protein